MPVAECTSALLMALDACLCDGLGSPGASELQFSHCAECCRPALTRVSPEHLLSRPSALKRSSRYPAAHLEAWPFSLPPPVRLPHCLCSWVSVDQPVRTAPSLTWRHCALLTWKPWRSPLGLFPAMCFLCGLACMGLASVSAAFVATEPGLVSHPRGLSTPRTGCPHSAAHPCLTALLTVGQKSVPVPTRCPPPLGREAWRVMCRSDLIPVSLASQPASGGQQVRPRVRIPGGLVGMDVREGTDHSAELGGVAGAIWSPWHSIGCARDGVSSREQDPGGAEEWPLRGRAEHPAAAAEDLQPSRAGGAPAPGVVVHSGASAVPLGLPCPQGARRGLLEGRCLPGVAQTHRGSRSSGDCCLHSLCSPALALAEGFWAECP